MKAKTIKIGKKIPPKTCPVDGAGATLTSPSESPFFVGSGVAGAGAFVVVVVVVEVALEVVVAALVVSIFAVVFTSGFTVDGGVDVTMVVGVGGAGADVGLTSVVRFMQYTDELFDDE